MEELELTPEQEQDYIDDPNHCPVCKSTNITGGHFDSSDYSATREVKCLDCKAQWVENFELVSISNVERDE
jgi:predicted Zn-ribbon and HTH transcriptional regulator